MSNSSPNSPPEPSSRPDFFSRLLQFAKRPSTIVISATAITVGVAGYVGTQTLVRRHLPPFLEKQLSQIFDREVKVGKVKSFSLSGIRLDPSSIPATPTDPDNLSIQGIEVNFNLLAILYKRTLPVNVTLVDPNIYLAQDESGAWVDLEIKLPEGKPVKLPFNLDVKVALQDLDIALLPQKKAIPLKIAIDGSSRYLKAENQEVDYNLNVAISGSEINLEGTTVVETGKSDLQLTVNKLDLPELVALIPNSPVSLNSGKFNADLKFNLPSFEEVESARGEGKVNLAQLEAKVKPLTRPIKATAKIQLQGQQVLFEEVKASLGEVVAQVSGKVDWQKGYDLDVDVKSFGVAKALKTFPLKLPIPVDGQIQANLGVTGPLLEPSLKGELIGKQIDIDKLQLRQLRAEFAANLEEFALKNLQIIPLAGGKITGSGVIETGFKTALEDKKPIDLMALPLAFNFNARLPTEELVAPYYILPANAAIGNINSQITVGGTPAKPRAYLKWQMPQASANVVGNVSGTGEVLLTGQNLLLRNTEIRTGTGKINAQGSASLKSKKWQASLNASRVRLDPFMPQISPERVSLNRPISLDSGNIRLSGSFDALDLQNIEANASLGLALDGGKAAVSSRLSKGKLVAFVTAGRIPLDNFLPDLAFPVTLQNVRLNLASSVETLSNTDWQDLQATVDARLAVADGIVNVSSNLDGNNISAAIQAVQIPVSQVVPNLPVAVTLTNTKVNLSGNVEQLISSLDSTPNLRSFTATVDAKLAAADGTVNVAAKLQQNQWQADVIASQIDLSTLPQLSETIKNIGQQNLAFLIPVNAKLDLSGSLDPLLASAPKIPIQAEEISVKSGEQSLEARGNILLSNLSTKPDASLELDVAVGSNLNDLPLTELISLVPVERQLLPQELDLRGRAKFQGKVQGNNLLSAPLASGNIALVGNLKLQDLSFNDIKFDPILAGNIKGAVGQDIALDLRGKQDVIAASLIPCTEVRCQLPYLPNTLEFRQGIGSESPLIATGKRQGDRFLAKVENFSLASLNIVPAEEYGLYGELQGKVNANLDVNLYDLTTTGNLNVVRPGIGQITAKTIAANFAYNSQSNIARLTSAYLQFGETQYDLTGSLNFHTGEIDSKLNTAKADIRDILTTLHWYEVKDVTNFLHKIPFATAAALNSASVGDRNAPLAEQINQLWQIDQKIKAMADQRKAGGIPTELDIRGKYTGEIALAGTLQDIKVNLKFLARDWQWRTKSASPNIVGPLGPIKEEIQLIGIEEILLQANFDDGIVTVEPARLQLGRTLLTASGNFSWEKLQANFEVRDLTMATISNFVTLPLDITGLIQVKGNLGGSPLNPRLEGEFAFIDGAFSGQALGDDIRGNFNYTDSRLQASTTAPSFFQVNASVPLPILTGANDEFEIDLKLGTRAFAWLNLLTQGQLAWIDGEGGVNLQASGSLDWNKPLNLEEQDLIVGGTVTLQDATLKAAAVPETLKVSGNIILEKDRINVQQIQGNIANSQLAVAGVLPLFEPLKPTDADAANPLIVSLEPQQLALDGLYAGEIGGEVVVTGAVLSPVIGGQVSLQNGKIFIPGQNGAQQVAEASSPNAASETWVRGGEPIEIKPPVELKLDNFRVVLANLGIASRPLYDFGFGGEITLNGSLSNNLDGLRPKGSVQIKRGVVNVVETRFLLKRRNQNQVVFKPEDGILNPYLDIELETLVPEAPDFTRQRLEQSNEIADDTLGRVQRVNINLAIRGQTDQLLPSLSKDAAQACQIRPQGAPIPQTNSFTQKELDNLAICLQNIAIQGDSDTQLLSNPIIELTSSPPRSEGEIVRLLSEQLFAIGKAFQGVSQGELLRVGAAQILVPLILQDIVYNVEYSIGNFLRVADLRLFPSIEIANKVGDEAFIRSSYDYTFNEFRVQYERRF